MVHYFSFHSRSLRSQFFCQVKKHPSAALRSRQFEKNPKVSKTTIAEKSASKPAVVGPSLLQLHALYFSRPWWLVSSYLWWLVLHFSRSYVLLCGFDFGTISVF